MNIKLIPSTDGKRKVLWPARCHDRIWDVVPTSYIYKRGVCPHNHSASDSSFSTLIRTRLFTSRAFGLAGPFLETSKAPILQCIFRTSGRSPSVPVGLMWIPYTRTIGPTQAKLHAQWILFLLQHGRSAETGDSKGCRNTSSVDREAWVGICNGLEIHPGTILMTPIGRNTAPSTALLTRLILKKYGLLSARSLSHRTKSPGAFLGVACA
jgi:hypothetical protein